MYSVETIQRITESIQFKQDFGLTYRLLALQRLGQGELFDQEAVPRLRHYVEAVLASAPSWDGYGMSLSRTAAEIAELLSSSSMFDSETQRHMRIRSAILYELANLPAIGCAVLKHGDLSDPLADFLLRRGLFHELMKDGDIAGYFRNGTGVMPPEESALSSDARSLALYLQGYIEKAETRGAELFAELSKEINFELTTTEVLAFLSILKRRVETSTRSNVEESLFQLLREIHFPPELWHSQLFALKEGLLDHSYDSWGLAAPTGTGKTFIARLLILDSLKKQPDRRILYVVPSRALVYEVASSLSQVFEPIGYRVVAVTPQLVSLEEEEASELEDAAVIILTPEKADMLLRLGLEIFQELSLVIVDEAHHIESGTRGILLEMYLWRIKTLLGDKTRFVFLSAVAPNIKQIADWVGKQSHSVVVDQRATRMRVGVYQIKGTGRNAQGWINYTHGVSLCLFESNVEPAQKMALIQLVERMGYAGPVLVVAKGKRECEDLAELMFAWLKDSGKLKGLSKEEQLSETVQRLDSRLEREMYAEVTLRKMVANRVAYHHAGLPPRVRTALEDAIRQNLIDFTFATTTLAEGVNFPFSTVIVQSLALREAPEKGRPAKYHPVTPRVFWNIAGRAGRPGYDREGQVLLFEPSLGLEKIKWVLKDYLDPTITAISPVRSALEETIRDISTAVSHGEISFEDLAAFKLSEKVSKRVQGAVNLLRISLIHAKASGLQESPEEIYERTFAATFMEHELDETARRLFNLQNEAIQEYLAQPNALSAEVLAELGLSIETVSDLRDWVNEMEDWQIVNIRKLLPGGELNLNQAKYIVAPVAKRMAELEGPKLGGFLSEVILLWLSGVQFKLMGETIRGTAHKQTIEDLIAVVYSRIQYLLPWGLYATDRLVETEARKRKIEYNNELRSLAYLADAGVPNFNALRLVSLEFERTDALRLTSLYKRRGGLRTGLDVVAWLAIQSMELIRECVKGNDNRRIDFDLEKQVELLRSEI
ncbi:MAG: DEAD/DEAH box helicase [Terriglobia bacterium]